jgi:hypothetical protein
MFASDWNSTDPRGTRVKLWPRDKNTAGKPVEIEVRASTYHLGSGALIIPTANGRNPKVTDVEPVVVKSGMPAAPAAYP